MILFFGTRPGKRKTFPLPNATCPHCGQSGVLAAQVVPHFVHLFWIPVYRLRPWRLVECGHCKRGYEAADLTPEMRRELAKHNA